MNPTRVFIHGLEGSGQGTKGRFFRERFPDMLIEDYDGSFARRMAKLQSLLLNKEDLILVGSSYGGLMAAAFACLYEERVNKMVLLAPALHLEPFESYCRRVLHVPVAVYHGANDEVVPMEKVRAITARWFANHTFTVQDDDHSLHRTFSSLDWDTLLTPGCSETARMNGNDPPHRGK